MLTQCAQTRSMGPRQKHFGDDDGVNDLETNACIGYNSSSVAIQTDGGPVLRSSATAEGEAGHLGCEITS